MRADVYAPADLHVPALERGFEVARVYAPVDDPADVRRDPQGTWHVRAGAHVRVRLTLVAPSVRYHAALVDPLPAGLEPVNAGLRGRTSATIGWRPSLRSSRPAPTSTPISPGRRGRAEMMYEPETFGRGAGDVVVVEARRPAAQ